MSKTLHEVRVRRTALSGWRVDVWTRTRTGLVVCVTCESYLVECDANGYHYQHAEFTGDTDKRYGSGCKSVDDVVQEILDIHDVGWD